MLLGEQATAHGQGGRRMRNRQGMIAPSLFPDVRVHPHHVPGWPGGLKRRSRGEQPFLAGAWT